MGYLYNLAKTDTFLGMAITYIFTMYEILMNKYFISEKASLAFLQPLLQKWELSDITIQIINYFIVPVFILLQSSDKNIICTRDDEKWLVQRFGSKNATGTMDWFQHFLVKIFFLFYLFRAVLDPPLSFHDLEGAWVFHLRLCGIVGTNTIFGFLKESFDMTYKRGFYCPKYCYNLSMSNSEKLRVRNESTPICAVLTK